FARVALLRAIGHGLPRRFLGWARGHQFGPCRVATRWGIVGTRARILRRRVGESWRTHPVHGLAELLLGSAGRTVEPVASVGFPIRHVLGVVANLALEVQELVLPCLEPLFLHRRVDRAGGPFLVIDPDPLAGR